MNDIISDEHLKSVMKFRRYHTLLKENEVLIRIGAYTKGSDAELDRAIAKKEDMEAFLTQKSTLQIAFEDSVNTLIEIMK
jgi:flagellum-specific ATP synthase